MVNRAAEPAQSPPQLTFREGLPTDWEQAASIVADIWGGEDYITAHTWANWTAPVSPGHLIAGLVGTELVGFIHLARHGMAEWWIEGIRVAEAWRSQGVGQALLGQALALFHRVGEGYVRCCTSTGNPASQRMITAHGFRHILSMLRVELPAAEHGIGGFARLTPEVHAMVSHYLHYSPMYRVNHFTERDWVLYYLTHDRLAHHLSAEGDEVLGWRSDDRLGGVALILGRDDSKRVLSTETALYVSYLDAEDDTTLMQMLAALQGLAARRGLQRVVWSMPAGVGLERTLGSLEGASFDDEELWLYELPIQLPQVPA